MNTWLSSIPNIDGDDVDRYKLHQILYRAFMPRPADSPLPFLFRVDPESGTLLVRSAEKPNWTMEGVRVTTETHTHKVGDIVRVVAHVSPRRRHHGKEVPSTPEQEQAYMINHLTKAGLRPLSLALHDADDAVTEPEVVIRRLYVGKEYNRKYPINPRKVECYCEVTDVPLMETVLLSGLGRMQFLGFGMLLLYPVDFAL